MDKKITSVQEDRLCDLFRECLRRLDFTEGEAQEIIKVGSKMQEQFNPILKTIAGSWWTSGYVQ